MNRPRDAYKSPAPEPIDDTPADTAADGVVNRETLADAPAALPAAKDSRVVRTPNTSSETCS
jgi:hypothetical protein